MYMFNVMYMLCIYCIASRNWCVGDDAGSCLLYVVILLFT